MTRVSKYNLLTDISFDHSRFVAISVFILDNLFNILSNALFNISNIFINLIYFNSKR